MKKILFSLLAVGVCGSLPLIASAAVSGKCSKCHTMHNSQNDSNMNLSRSWTNDSQPNEVLLRSDCIGCHSGDQSWGSLGGTNDDMYAPRIYLTATTQATLNDSSYKWLPGGYFDPATDTEMRHNPSDLPGAAGDNDSLFAVYMANDFAPPGYTQLNSKRPGNSAAWTTQLTCAGEFGCHGWTDKSDNGDSMLGIAGHHHGNDSPYRYLRAGASQTPVKGTGVAWSAFTANTGNGGGTGPASNVYFANDSALADGGGAGDFAPTISRLCAECHGLFHGEQDQGNVATGNTLTTYTNAWLRHPTDLQMTTARSNARATRDQWDRQTTSNMVPIGSSDPAANATAGNGYVICLSCHVAHGGGYKDLLRWSYSWMDAGTNGAGAVGVGCFICHTTKDQNHQ